MTTTRRPGSRTGAPGPRIGTQGQESPVKASTVPSQARRKASERPVAGSGRPKQPGVQSEAPKRRRKFLNEPVEINGLKFDSRSEGARYMGLYVAQQMGEIHDLEVHPRYRFEVNGVLIGTYRPDFRYIVAITGLTVVEDVKSKPTITEAYRLRKKLMRALYNIEVIEVIP